MDKNALIKCPYCNNVVPKNVLLCPHCNHILRDERNMEGNEELNIANNSQDNNVFSNNTNPVFVFNQDSEKKTKPVFSINKLMFLFIGILIGASIACLTILGISRFSINHSKQNTDMLETQADKKKLQEETTDINNVFDGETQEKAKTDEAADGMPSNSYASIGIGENVLVNTEDGDVEISVDGGSLVDWNIYDGGNRTGAGTAIASIRCKIKNISHEHWEYLGYSLASSGYFQLLDENDVAVAYYDISGPVDGVYEPNVDVAKGATRYVSMPFVVNDNLTKASVVLGKQYLLEIDFDKTGELINNNTEVKTNGIVNSMGNDEDVGQDTPEEKHVDKNIDNIEMDNGEVIHVSTSNQKPVIFDNENIKVTIEKLYRQGDYNTIKMQVENKTSDYVLNGYIQDAYIGKYQLSTYGGTGGQLMPGKIGFVTRSINAEEVKQFAQDEKSLELTIRFYLSNPVSSETYAEYSQNLLIDTSVFE